jgi:hypothetical protein
MKFHAQLQMQRRQSVLLLFSFPSQILPLQSRQYPGQTDLVDILLQVTSCHHQCHLPPLKVHVLAIAVKVVQVRMDVSAIGKVSTVAPIMVTAVMMQNFIVLLERQFPQPHGHV